MCKPCPRSAGPCARVSISPFLTVGLLHRGQSTFRRSLPLVRGFRYRPSLRPGLGTVANESHWVWSAPVRAFRYRPSLRSGFCTVGKASRRAYCAAKLQSSYRPPSRSGFCTADGTNSRRYTCLFLRNRKPTLPHQCFDLGIAPAEQAICFRRIDRIADREHILH
jgi:hypothetical protein